MSFSLIDVFTKNLFGPELPGHVQDTYVLDEKGFTAYTHKDGGVPYSIRLESEMDDEPMLVVNTSLSHVLKGIERYKSLLDFYMGLQPGKSALNSITRKFGLEAMRTLLPRSKYFLENEYIFLDDFQIARRDGLEFNDRIIERFQQALNHLRYLLIPT